MMNSSSKNRYIPKQLPLTRPSGENIFEFAIEAYDKVGSFANIVRVFSNHNVDIKSVSAGKMEESDHFVSSLFCDFTNGECTVEQIKEELEHLRGIISVQSANMDGKLWDKFFFPLNLMKNKNRVIIMRVEPLLRVERNLIQTMGSAGASIMFQEGQTYANEVFLQYKEILPKVSTKEFLETIKDGLRTTGWGLFDFIPTSDNGFIVKVVDPPVLKEADYSENRFFYGVAAKILENLYGGSYALTESSFDRATKTLRFRLSRKIQK
jgi:predicted amino acid-binding ACT domain protein